MKKYVLAFDFGASSGRAMVGQYDAGKLVVEEVHRFPNYPKEVAGEYAWDLAYLFEQILEGIRQATKRYPIASIGIDTWGVDIGLLDAAGNLLAPPRSYRDPYTQGMLEKVAEKIPLKELYQRTGNQLMPINTLFQLMALKEQKPALMEKVAKILWMPDLFNYLLTGEIAAERSIASTAQMVNVRTKNWDTQLLEILDLNPDWLPPLVQEGNVLGRLKPELGFEAIPVINICAHDTASAVVSVPSKQNFLFISCGTWSLVGTEIKAPVTNEKAFSYNLTNESGINQTTRFLKNCTGLWIIQEVKRQLAAQGKDYSYEEMMALADRAPAFQTFIDTDDECFIAPGQMIERIQTFAHQTNQRIPQSDGEVIRCVYESLAMKYKYTLLEIIDALQSEFDTINILGGGAQATILCQMVADASNLRVCAGPVEATAIGNMAVQLQAQGVFKDVLEIREWVKAIADVKYYYPTEENAKWERQFSTYQKILKINQETKEQ